jgi:hypothetical protein
VSRVSDGTSPRREDIDLTEHAVEQYRARRRPALDHAGARAELAPLAPNGEILSAAPNWVRAAGSKPFDVVIGATVRAAARSTERLLGDHDVPGKDDAPLAPARAERAREAPRTIAERAGRRARW